MVGTFRGGRTSCTSLGLLLALLVPVMGVPPQAQAASRANSRVSHVSKSTPRAEARRQFETGEHLFRTGQYRDAARAYQRGYQAYALPGFLINIAHCHVRLGNNAEARRHYERFLATEPTSARRAEVERALASLQAPRGQREIANSTGALRGGQGPVGPEASSEAYAAPMGAALSGPPAPSPPILPLGLPSALSPALTPLTAQNPARERTRGLEVRAWEPRAFDVRRDGPTDGLQSSGGPSAWSQRWLPSIVGGLTAGVVTGLIIVTIGRGGENHVPGGTIGTLSR